MQRLIITLIAIIAASCTLKEKASVLKTGIWRATIEMQGQKLPFNFDLVKDKQGGYDIYIHNAGE